MRIIARIGVNTGPVIAGDPSAGERLVTGDAVNVAAPAWFDRDGPGFTDPNLSADVLGLLCVLLVVLQLALLLVAMIAFRQRWNVEAERTREPAPA